MLRWGSIATGYQHSTGCGHSACQWCWVLGVPGSSNCLGGLRVRTPQFCSVPGLPYDFKEITLVFLLFFSFLLLIILTVSCLGQRMSLGVFIQDIYSQVPVSV